jgi:hypothetical protein
MGILRAVLEKYLWVFRVLLGFERRSLVFLVFADFELV